MGLSLSRAQYAVAPIDLGIASVATQYGIAGDGRYVTDAAITSGSAVVTSTTGPFLSTDVGKVVCVRGAGASGVSLVSTVATYTSATSVTLAATASTTVSNVQACVGTDDQTGLQAALDALRPNQTLRLARGKKYLHSGVLTMNNASTTIDGNQSGILVGYVAASCTFKIAAASCSVVDLQILLPGTATRVGTPESSSLYVNQVSGFYGYRVSVENSGMFLYGATDYELVDPVVRNTLGDGIHQTFGCQSGKVVRPTVIKPGDDGVAIVSYTSDGTICKDIWVSSPRVWGQTYGRGVTCVGGTDITYTDVQVYGSDGAGIYFAQESSTFVTYPITRVKALGGRLSFANRNVGASGDHGAVMLFGEATSGVISGVEISDFVIEDTRTGATENFRTNLLNGTTLSNVTVDRLQFRGGGPNYDWPAGGWTAGITATNIDALYKQYTPVRVTANTTTTSLTSGQIGSCGWGISSAGTYLMELEGAYQSSLTTAGPRFGVTGNVTSVGTVQVTVEQNTATTAVTKTVEGWATNGGVNPGTASTSFPLKIRALVTVTAIPANATLQFTWLVSAASTGTLVAGAVAKLTRLA